MISPLSRHLHGRRAT